MSDTEPNPLLERTHIIPFEEAKNLLEGDQMRGRLDYAIKQRKELLGRDDQDELGAFICEADFNFLSHASWYLDEFEANPNADYFYLTKQLSGGKVLVDPDEGSNTEKGYIDFSDIGLLIGLFDEFPERRGDSYYSTVKRTHPYLQESLRALGTMLKSKSPHNVLKTKALKEVYKLGDAEIETLIDAGHYDRMWRR